MMLEPTNRAISEPAPVLGIVDGTTTLFAHSGLLAG
ncbi:MAG: hypothetical protein QG647_679, partial [Patescibacteria group bacterium]|nr:hypothetical protein [Patescibacteria group bacterium]